MKTKVVLRELRSPAEFAEAGQVAKAAWRFEDAMVSPPPDLIAATHAGGLTAGAFEAKRMLGFVHGIPRTNMGQPCQHSHLLAVHPSAQGLGLASRLKLFQRAWCLERGIRLATWTYDPFLLKNARLNLVRLRATAAEFLPDFYGPMGGIYGALPSDRFEVRWRLDDPIVERAARGEDAFAPALDLAAIPVVTPRRVAAGRHVALPFPAGAPELFRDDVAAGIRARRRFGRAAIALFERGYEAISVHHLEGRDPFYVFERR